MKKSVIILFIYTIILLTGCYKPKEDYTVNETLNETSDEAIINETQITSITPNMQVSIPKISSLNYLGKDSSSDNEATIAKITDVSSEVDDNIYVSLLYQEKDLTTEELKEKTEILRLPNSPHIYIDETFGKVISNSFTRCNKIIVKSNEIIMAGYNNLFGGMRVEAYPLTDSSKNWHIVKGTQIVSESGSALFEGNARDCIECGDNTVVYISNIPDETGINNCFITKIDDGGNKIWSKQLFYNNESLYLEKIVQSADNDEFLVLGRTSEDFGYCIIKIESGEIVNTAQLEFYADNIKSVGDDYFILGTSQKYTPESSIDINDNSTAKVVKMNSSLDIIYTYTNEAVNKISDFIQLEDDMYLFVGNKGWDTYIASYYDTGETLELVKTDRYEELGQPTRIIKHNTIDKTEYIMTGINKVANGTHENTYSWIAHLYTLKSALNSYYKEITNNDGHAKFLKRGDDSRLTIAYTIADYEGNNELMYIRYMKSDGYYAYVITGAWYNAQIIEQYLLQNKNNKWQVLEKFTTTDRSFEKIKANYPEVDASILPPFEVADYVIKILDDQKLKDYIGFIDKNKLVGDISYCSYIGDYFCVSFKDGTSYLVKYPESPSREIYVLNKVNTYNFYLLDEEKPPYFILMQD